MKTTIHQLQSTFAIILIFFLVSCKKDLEIFNKFVIGITETSGTLNWVTNQDEYTSAYITLFPEFDPSASLNTYTVDNNSEKSIVFEGLKGLTEYNYEISLLGGSEELVREKGSFRTTYTSEKTNLFTRDSFTLKGEISYMSAWDNKVPAIIMMHGLSEVMNIWQDSDTMEKLLKEGYACMTFFNRGHKNSDDFPLELFEGPDAVKYLGADVEAAIQGLKEYEFIDPMKVGLMGGSMGGSSSVIGNFFPEVCASVPLGPVWPADGTVQVKKFFPELESSCMQSIYCIASEKDIVQINETEYNFPAMARNVYNDTRAPRKLWIINGPGLHGSKLTTYPGVQDSLTAWFVEQMPSPYSSGY